MYKACNAFLLLRELPLALLLGGLAANAAPQKQHFDLSIRIMPQVVDGRVLNIKVSETFRQRLWVHPCSRCRSSRIPGPVC